MVGAERELLTTIKRRQWRFIGQELRGGSIERNILEADMAGNRARGRQRLKMLDWMMERLRGKNGKREHRHDLSTVFDAMTLEEEVIYIHIQSALDKWNPG